MATHRQLVCGALIAALMFGVGEGWAADEWQATEGWFTLHHDAERSGRTQYSPGVPFQYVWHREYWAELIAPEVEPIVAEGLVFFGTLKGIVHALDANTGQEQWQADLGAPIHHSPAYERGRLFVATMGRQGEVVAFTARDGDVRWRFRPHRPGGFAASPAVTQGVIFLGDRAGDFYALEAATGREKWHVRLGGPILQSASVRDGKVAIAAEDLAPHLLRAADGHELWQAARMNGATVRGYYPVFWRDLVVWRTDSGAMGAYHNDIEQATPEGELYRQTRRQYGWSKQAEETIKGIPGRYTDEEYRREQSYVQHQMAMGRHPRSFYAFRVEDGQEPRIYAVGYHASENGYSTPASPPVGPDGRLYVFTKSIFSEWTYPIRAFDAVSTLDYASGLPHLLRGIDRSQGSFPATSDESNNLTLAGNRLYDTHDHVLAYLDLKTGRVYNAYSSHAPELWGGVFKAYAPDNLPAEKAGAWHLRDTTNSLHLTFQWNGPSQGAVAIYRDKVWWVTGSMVVCLQGTAPPWVAASDGARPPAAAITADKPTGQNHVGQAVLAFDPAKAHLYLEGRLESAGRSTATDLRRELARAVDEILSGPWQPLYSDYSAAEAGGVGPAEWCFNRPGDYLLALAEAAPCLAAEPKSRAHRWLQGMLRACPPTREVYLKTTEGKSRNLRQTPPVSWPALGGPETERSLFAEAYAVWAYAEAYHAWEEVKPLFADLQKLRRPLENRGDFQPKYRTGDDGALTAAELQDPEYRFRVCQALLAGCQDNYGYRGARAARERMEPRQPIFFYIKQLSALTGYYRLARQYGLAEEEQWAERLFNQVAALALGQKSAPYLWSDPCLNPMIGRLIRDAAGPWLDEWARTPNVGILPATDWNNRAVPGRRDYLVTNPYTWFHAWGGQGEGVRPRTVLGAYLANAYLLRASPIKLVQTLDIPWSPADLFYVRKLVTAIQAVEGARWETPGH